MIFKVSISKGYPTNLRPEVLRQTQEETPESIPSNGRPSQIDEDLNI